MTSTYGDVFGYYSNGLSLAAKIIRPLRGGSPLSGKAKKTGTAVRSAMPEKSRIQSSISTP
jgi:hypothetical protein